MKSGKGKEKRGNMKKPSVMIGLAELNEMGTLKAKRGREMLSVEEEWGAEELKSAAIDKMATYNNSFCGLGSYVILYHDFVELKYLPGTLVPFNMKQYKLDRGMPYSKIVFFLCVC